MKKAYEKPQMEWVSLQPDVPIAAPCWANAGKQAIYHDLPGVGYCEVHLSKGGCGKAKIVSVIIPDEFGLTSQQKAEMESWFMGHLAEKMAAAGNNMASFKGSEFTTAPDPDWS